MLLLDGIATDGRGLYSLSSSWLIDRNAAIASVAMQEDDDIMADSL